MKKFVTPVDEVSDQQAAQGVREFVSSLPRTFEAWFVGSPTRHSFMRNDIANLYAFETIVQNAASGKGRYNIVWNLDQLTGAPDAAGSLSYEKLQNDGLPLSHAHDIFVKLDAAIEEQARKLGTTPEKIVHVPAVAMENTKTYPLWQQLSLLAKEWKHHEVVPLPAEIPDGHKKTAGHLAMLWDNALVNTEIYKPYAGHFEPEPQALMRQRDLRTHWDRARAAPAPMNLWLPPDAAHIISTLCWLLKPSLDAPKNNA